MSQKELANQIQTFFLCTIDGQVLNLINSIAMPPFFLVDLVVKLFIFI